jgi:hypothetical protein
MASQILAAGSGAANSSEVTVTAGTPVTVFLKDAVGIEGVPAGADVRVKVKDDAGAFFQIGKLTAEQPATVLIGPGVYIFSRTADSSACGVCTA